MVKIFLALILSFAIVSQPAFAVGKSGLAVRTVYSSTNVGVTNWVVLAPTIPYTVSQIVIADLSGQTMEIGMCDASAVANSEVRQFLVPPGGVTVHIQIPPSQRISIRAVSGVANTGENDLNILF